MQELWEAMHFEPHPDLRFERYLRSMQRVRSIAWLGASFLLASPCALAQSDSLETGEASWWKSLFRPKTVEIVEAESPVLDAESAPKDRSGDAPLDTVAAVQPPLFDSVSAAPEVATWRMESDGRLLALDSAWKASPPAMKGYRIQLMTGTLQECRRERSALRSTTDWSIYLVPLSMNYQLMLGDFRDPWSAEREREYWLETHPQSLVVPGPIALPPLNWAENNIAEPREGLGDE